MAGGLAKWISTAIGNDSTDDISIMDTAGNVLFTGGDSATAINGASSQLSYKTKAESMVKSQVKDVVLGTNVYDTVSVGRLRNGGNLSRRPLAAWTGRRARTPTARITLHM